jgi:ribosomal protein L40E
MAMKICRACGGDNPADAVGCQSCGSPDLATDAQTNSEGGGSLILNRTRWLKKLFKVGMVLGVMGTFLTLSTGFGYTSRGRYHPPQPKAFHYTPWAVLLFVTSLALSWRVTDCYVVDASQRRISHQSDYFFIRRVRPLLEGTDLAAVLTTGRRSGSRRGYWDYRVVAFTWKGRAVPLTDWLCDDLERCHTLAARLAQIFECPLHQSPPRSEATIRFQQGDLSVSFVPARFGLTRRDRWIYASIAIVVLAGIAFVLKVVWSQK